jgi:hypothetical protein
MLLVPLQKALAARGSLKHEEDARTVRFRTVRQWKRTENAKREKNLGNPSAFADVSVLQVRRG